MIRLDQWCVCVCVHAKWFALASSFLGWGGTTGQRKAPQQALTCKVGPGLSWFPARTFNPAPDWLSRVVCRLPQIRALRNDTPPFPPCFAASPATARAWPKSSQACLQNGQGGQGAAHPQLQLQPSCPGALLLQPPDQGRARGGGGSDVHQGSKEGG